MAIENNIARTIFRHLFFDKALTQDPNHLNFLYHLPNTAVTTMLSLRRCLKIENFAVNGARDTVIDEIDESERKWVDVDDRRTRPSTRMMGSMAKSGRVNVIRSKERRDGNDGDERDVGGCWVRREGVVISRKMVDVDVEEREQVERESVEHDGECAASTASTASAQSDLRMSMSK
ncbi:hypothetical protein SISNIDRAFT_498801 [Sistotremastrum niveocremeum HHB9708]|uniref:Uncharacterized protein n=1 Tax=Sistotremastrum niveocremeum HHB9708 TaxID=1314777 RepID=A0A164M681_9AGAM|nr:hypothetical protein SISNIDRAFT_498801 [Sistotremastrum niveocremeum HHB9708]